MSIFLWMIDKIPKGERFFLMLTILYCMRFQLLSSQKVVSDWNSKGMSVWFMWFKKVSLNSGMIIFSERSFQYFFIQITVMNQAMMFSFWTLGRYLWYQNCSEGQNRRRLLTISARKWEYFFNSMLMTKLLFEFFFFRYSHLTL